MTITKMKNDVTIQLPLSREVSGEGFDFISHLQHQCIVIHAWPIHGYPCLASKTFAINNVLIQVQKLNGSILKYGILVSF